MATLVLGCRSSRGPSRPGLASWFELHSPASVYPRQYLLQDRKELLPPALGALVGLLLIRRKPDCSMRRWVPVLVGVRVQVTTLSRP
jgi:hypothetical protein